MITFTATETRTNLNIPFTYDNPLYSSTIHQAYQLYADAGINVTVETSADGLVQTITHTCSDDQADLFTELHRQVVATIENLYQNTDASLPFARVTGIETAQTQSFDDAHKNLEPVFAGHYKVRNP